jgi:hypothetical protein
VTAIILTHLGFGLVAIGGLAVLRPIRWLRLRPRSRGLALAATGAAIALVGFLMPAGTISVSRPETELDRALPRYQFDERHSIEIPAPPERVYHAIKNVTAAEIALFRGLTWLRRFGRPGPETILNPGSDRPLLEVATTTTFAMLADTPREVLVGTVVAAPAGYVRDRAPLADHVLAVRDRPGFAVAALTFIVTPRGDTGCTLTTETRVFASDAPTRRRFAAYWRIIYPGSDLIRRMWLRAIRDRATRGRESPRRL